jgi:hypothetical protein
MISAQPHSATDMTARLDGATSFVTFDRKAAQMPGIDLLSV